MTDTTATRELIQNKTNALATKQGKHVGYKGVLEAYMPQLQKVMRGQDPNRLVRTMLMIVNGDFNLQKVAKQNPMCVVGAALEIAAKQLDPAVHNEVFLVPYQGKNPTIVVQEGYKGLQKLAHRAAQRLNIGLEFLGTSEICENDIYSRGRGDRPFVNHLLPKFGEPRGDTIGYYAVARYSDGGVYFQEMTVEQVEEHKKRFSKAVKGPFADPKNFDSYGRKTVLRLLINRDLPMDAELTEAVQKDIQIETGEYKTEIVQPELEEIEAEPTEEQDHE
jgi:recombination protein RecT